MRVSLDEFRRHLNYPQIQNKTMTFVRSVESDCEEQDTFYNVQFQTQTLTLLTSRTVAPVTSENTFHRRRHRRLSLHQTTHV